MKIGKYNGRFQFITKLTLSALRLIPTKSHATLPLRFALSQPFLT